MGRVTFLDGLGPEGVEVAQIEETMGTSFGAGSCKRASSSILLLINDRLRHSKVNVYIRRRRSLLACKKDPPSRAQAPRYQEVRYGKAKTRTPAQDQA